MHVVKRELEKPSQRWVFLPLVSGSWNSPDSTSCFSDHFFAGSFSSIRLINPAILQGFVLLTLSFFSNHWWAHQSCFSHHPLLHPGLGSCSLPFWSIGFSLGLSCTLRLQNLLRIPKLDLQSPHISISLQDCCNPHSQNHALAIHTPSLLFLVLPSATLTGYTHHPPSGHREQSAPPGGLPYPLQIEPVISASDLFSFPPHPPTL